MTHEVISVKRLKEIEHEIKMFMSPNTPPALTTFGMDEILEIVVELRTLKECTNGAPCDE